MHSLCLAENIAVLPWSPLARGRLTRPWGENHTARLVYDKFGKKRCMNEHSEDNDARIAERVDMIAKVCGVSRAQVALAWMLSKPRRSSWTTSTPTANCYRQGHQGNPHADEFIPNDAAVVVVDPISRAVPALSDGKSRRPGKG